MPETAFFLSRTDMSFIPKGTRKFYLSEGQTARLGGPQVAEIMRLQVEERLTAEEIRKRLQISELEFNTATLTHYYKRQLQSQLKARDHDKTFRAAGSIDPREINLIHGGVAKPKEKLPAAIANFKLPKGVSPTEYAVGRIADATPQAVEKLIFLMQNSRNDSIQYNAAVKLLGLNGIVEIEKSINVIADAEAIIRELNRSAQPIKPIVAEITEADVLSSELEVIDDSSADPRGDPRSDAEVAGDAPVGGAGEPSQEASVPNPVDRSEHAAVAPGPVDDAPGWRDLYPRPSRPSDPSQAVPGEPVA